MKSTRITVEEIAERLEIVSRKKRTDNGAQMRLSAPIGDQMAPTSTLANGNCVDVKNPVYKRS